MRRKTTRKKPVVRRRKKAPSRLLILANPRKRRATKKRTYKARPVSKRRTYRRNPIGLLGRGKKQDMQTYAIMLAVAAVGGAGSLYLAQTITKDLTGKTMGNLKAIITGVAAIGLISYAFQSNNDIAKSMALGASGVAAVVLIQRLFWDDKKGIGPFDSVMIMRPEEKSTTNNTAVVGIEHVRNKLVSPMGKYFRRKRAMSGIEQSGKYTSPMSGIEQSGQYTSPLSGLDDDVLSDSEW